MKTAQFILLSTAMLLTSLSVMGQSGRPTASLKDPRVQQLNASDPKAYLPDEVNYELQWPHLPESNILWARRLWRTIDTRNELNSHLVNVTGEGATLAKVLIEGALNDRYKVYDGSDTRFTVSLGKDSFVALLNSEAPSAYAKFDAAACTRYQIKEDWLYLAAEKKLIVRIIGIAPLREVRSAGGITKQEPVFWLYYVPVRNYLREQEVVDPEDGRVQNLDQIFETRQFVSTIDTAGAFKTKWGCALK